VSETAHAPEALVASFHAALAANAPAALTRAHLPDTPPALVLAVGKAALPMAAAAEERFPGVPGLVITREGHGGETAGFEVRETSHPVPDERSEAAGEAALAMLGALGKDDLALVLVSGGGSALVAAPWGVSLEEKRETTQALLRSGASIDEINAVRKHLSRTKGGQLAAATKARVRTLVLSDVPGDDLAVVASGPTVPDPSTFADALEVLDRYELGVPAARAHLERGARGELDETPKPGDPRLAGVETRLIGGGWQLLEAAAGFWRDQGMEVAILSDRFGGEARELARFHASLVHAVREHGAPFQPPVVLLSGGEAAVTVRGEGLGGRNQEFLAHLAVALGGAERVWAIACDTDGIDGVTSAAGATIAPDTLARVHAAGLDPAALMADNDVHPLFAQLGDLVVTGPTRNNLNDYRAILVA